MKKVLSIVIAAVLITSLVGCSSNNNQSSKTYLSSQRIFIEKTSFGNYADYVNLAYDSVDMSNINDRDKVLLIESDLEEPRLYGTAQDGNDFYGWSNLERWSDLYRFTIVDDQTVKREVWISREQLLNSCLSPDKEANRNITLSNFMAFGDSVYATMGFDMEWMQSQVDLNGRIVRISKSGDKIELVGDESVRAAELVVRDGWIYYSDNGYRVEGDSYQYLGTEIGLYKIKTDGSQKTLLRSGTSHPINYNYERGTAGDLALYEDYLYFLDLDNESRLCRMKTDGSDYEQISQTGAFVYTMDTDTQVFYFKSGTFGANKLENKDVSTVSLIDKTEKKLCDVSQTIYQMSFCDDYLYYYAYYDSGLSSGNAIAYRINPADGKVQRLERRVSDNTISWYDL